MFCCKCGASVPKSAYYCHECGAPQYGVLEIGTLQTSGITIVDLRGKLIGELCNPLKEHMAGILAARPTERILLNLENVSGIDARGRGMLVWAWKDTREHGGDLKLVCPEGEVLEVLRISKLIGILQVFATESEALASFQ